MTITVDKDNDEVLVVETVCDLFELLSQNKIWVRLDKDTSLCKFINTDKAEKDAFIRRNERWQ